MIYARKLVIEEFRGIRKLAIEFKGENFAVCGPNGTGKSGIVDALEFALTGNISRLSGRGTGSVSVKEHAPHVDSRDRPDKARVILTVAIPTLKKEATIERRVNSANAPTITPNTPDVIAALGQVALHPEFALSRRELIRYVISTPGDRAKEVQALLRLDAIEDLRVILQKLANSADRSERLLKEERDRAAQDLLRALEIADLSSTELLTAANARRALLGLGPISVLTPTTSLRDGLIPATQTTQPSRVPKAQATADLKRLREVLDAAVTSDSESNRSQLVEKLEALAKDPAVTAGVEKEKFLRSALALIDGEACPTCDTPWDSAKLREHIAAKLAALDEAAAKRRAMEMELAPFVDSLHDTSEALAAAERYAALLVPPINCGAVRAFKESIAERRKRLQDFLPLATTVAALRDFVTLPAAVDEIISKIETAVAALPEPSQQDAARDYLTVCQERLEAYRGVSLRLKQAEGRKVMLRKIYETYARTSTSVLDGIYKDVEKEFSDLYRYINRDDEAGFTALLTPSTGKLGFDVDFYGRGLFPPGAYHSEGHQDGMGVCLYLALMDHLLGDHFTFAVLDDVLMSVDTGHRRAVCNLLKERFPKTQFILTTHDEIWLRHMRAVGLVAPQAFMHFRKWDVDHGPTEWDERDVWAEIESELGRGDVRAAAGLLRHYLEFISGEISHRLRAPVEFRGDAHFQLGELLPAATRELRRLLKKGKESATSWKRQPEADAIVEREKTYTALVAASNVEQWQINPAIHYNEWANLHAADFGPVVKTYKELVAAFHCTSCGGLLYVIPDRGKEAEELRCPCGSTSINLRRK